MIFFLLFLSLFLRLSSLNQSFWIDEAAQAVLSTKPILAINYAADFQPPLYYVLTHFWLLLGINNEWFLRLSSVFFGLATVAALYYFLKILFGRKTAILGTAFLATAPLHIYYSQEFRLYSFLTFLILLSWILLWKKRWVSYGIVILSAVFTHYFAFLAILSQFVFVFLFDKKNVSRFAFHVLLFLSPFLLWLPTLLAQLETAKRLTALWPKWGSVLGFSFTKFPLLVIAKFTVGFIRPENKTFYAASVFCISIILIIAILKLLNNHFQPPRLNMKPFKAEVGLFLLFFFIPLIITWSASLVITASTPTRLLFILPAYYSLLAIGLGRLNRYWFTAAISIILTLNLYYSASYLINTKNHRENWREAISYTDARVGDRGIVLTESDVPFVPIYWYSKNGNRYVGASTTFQITNKSVKDRLAPMINRSNPIILYSYLFEISDPSRIVEKYLKSRDLMLSEEKDFRGVGIIRTYTIKE